jgi:hypothetical protein
MSSPQRRTHIEFNEALRNFIPNPSKFEIYYNPFELGLNIENIYSIIKVEIMKCKIVLEKLWGKVDVFAKNIWNIREYD